MRGWSRTEIAQKEPAHGYQWSSEGHTPQEQAQVKSEGRKAKTECQNREEWGHHVPNRKGMEKWQEGRARTSQPEVHCREEQALVEEEAEVGGRHCREGQRVDRKRRRRTTRPVGLSKTIAAEEEH